MTGPPNELPADALPPLEGDLGQLTDDAYFDHLEAAKAAGIEGVDDQGRRYAIDEGVVDERGIAR